MRRLILLSLLLSLIFTALARTITDIDGNTYTTVKISDQAWMAQNLAFSKAPDGSSIMFHPYLGMEDSVKFYGRIYDWENARKACPSAWHLPCDEGWLSLIKYLGGPMIASGKIKETGTSHWKSPNKEATSERGLNL